MRAYFAALIVALGAASTMTGTSIVALGPQDYTYDLHLPSITISGVSATENDATSFDIEFSWLGPEMYNAGDNTSCPLGCPVTGSTAGSPAAGFSDPSFAFTASTAEDCATALPADGCGEVLLSFQDSKGDKITYSLIEPDLFWSTSGLHTFGAGDGVGSGASWVYQAASSELPADPPCTACSVTTSQSPVAPEPGTWLLLASGLGMAGLVARRQHADVAGK